MTASEPRIPARERWSWVRWIVLAGLGVAVRAPALRGEFIWDDLELIARNPLIRSPLFLVEAFRHYLFPGAHSGHYRPAQTVSYMFDYWWWNGETLGFHVTNVALHVVAGVLLFALLRQLFASLRLPEMSPILSPENLAWMAALLWVVHPAHSAAVDYLSGRADSLAFCFAAGGWLFFLRGSAHRGGLAGRVLFLVAAALCALLALCSRESGAIWLAVFLLHLFGVERDLSPKRKLLALLASVSVAGAYLWLRHLPHYLPEAAAALAWSLPMRATLMLRALGDDAAISLFPWRLLVERTVLTRTAASGVDEWRSMLTADALPLLGVLVLAIFTWGICRKSTGQRTRIFGAAWFLLAYLPTSNLFPLNATVAEHWLYLPSVGLLIFAVGCAADLPSRWSRVVAAVAGLAVLLFSARSIVRSGDWVNAETFFRRTFAAGGTSSRIGVNLAVVYAQRGDHAKAEEILRKVLAVTPRYPLAQANLVLALQGQGKTAEAVAISERPPPASPSSKSAEYPATSDGALQLARAHHAAHKEAAALAIVDEALREIPDTWDLASLRAQIVEARDGQAAAIRVVEQFVAQNWWSYSSRLTLAKLRAQGGATDAAIADFERASRLDVHEVEALNALALLEAGRKHLERACGIQARAVHRRPHEPRQWLILSELLEAAGRHAEAQQAATRAASRH